MAAIGIAVTVPLAAVSPSGAASSSAAAAPSTASAVVVHRGDRVVVIGTSTSEPRYLAVNRTGRVGTSTTSRPANTRLVVVPVVPGSSSYLLKTVTLTAGEPNCLASTPSGHLVTQACDTRVLAQHFALGGSDDGTFTIQTAHGLVVAGAQGRVRITLDDATSFTATDMGPYESPFD
jgi:hypothetical protein